MYLSECMLWRRFIGCAHGCGFIAAAAAAADGDDDVDDDDDVDNYSVRFLGGENFFNFFMYLFSF